MTLCIYCKSEMTKCVTDFLHDEIWKCERHGEVLIKEYVNYIVDSDSHYHRVSATALCDMLNQNSISLLRDVNKTKVVKAGKDVVVIDMLIDITPENFNNKLQTIVNFS